MKNTKSTRTTILLSCVMVFVCGIVAATVLAAGQNRDTETVGVSQWEYCSLRVKANRPANEAGRQILKLGQEGWELVSVENFSESGSTTATAYYFKRPL